MPNTTAPLISIVEIIIRFAPKSKAGTAITRETRLSQDLEIDSPRMIDIVLELEDHFGITLEDVDVQNTATIGDLLDIVQERAARN
jgi:acyl carrier protein